MDILIRKASEQDLPWLLAMERETFSDSWTEKNLEDSLRLHPEDNYIAVRPELCEPENRHAGETRSDKRKQHAGEIRLGYLLLMRAADEGEILRIAVSPAYKRRGVADAMMRALEIWSCSHGIRSVYLEVRADNDPAIALYRKNGFQVQGIRKRYYHDPVCDAVIMSRIEDDIC
ncbi:MAG: ribosomal protein S18-alanine N-acetyltransferase [Lachnospiraceae bacterium]|nr:ribosomal protein S18-alanine N-acetyltransferase [Lachnospiraceae bacterium]